MRALVLSDIHGSLEGLEAVLEAVGTVDAVWDLGDVVGYGASPNDVVEKMRSIGTLHVRGNHDRVAASLSSSLNFNPVARAAALWTQEALSPENMEWVREMPHGPVQPEGIAVSLVHGSPLDEDDYILSVRDAWAPLQQMTQPITFFGHTHVQGGFIQQGTAWRELIPEYRTRDTAETWELTISPESRYLINPGSAGQPRDGDWRVAAAVYDTEASTVTFHRLPYDIIKAQGKILMAGLPDRLALRLRDGK
ncbi:metallophosphoesterase family protein [Terriglobus tenax]|uniref:metallophosphoesterase family protein n=1 Tax=Terriglobus tenax TaxID=1111115 RepID=UPI0021DF66A4|nr:metallophosphoesterase family protein [Terriglobus tenax]